MEEEDATIPTPLHDSTCSSDHPFCPKVYCIRSYILCYALRKITVATMTTKRLLKILLRLPKLTVKWVVPQSTMKAGFTCLSLLNLVQPFRKPL